MAARIRTGVDVVVKAACTAGLSSVFACWWYRPAVDRRDGQGTRRAAGMSAIDYHDTYCRPYPLPMQLGAYASTALMVCACRAFIYGLGDFDVKEDEHYQNFVEKSLSRDPRTPMFTLPNHRSLMDDPMMLASILPFWMNVQPHYLRWAVCAQEICFREENVVTAFFGVGGKTLPLCRGEGVDQPQLLQLARKAVSASLGDGSKKGRCQTTGSTERSAGWINIHSEAGIFQNHHALGGRHNGREGELGRLKWGAAKMIVHNPSYDISPSSLSGDSPPGPVVIPFYVSGMDSVTPLNENKRLIQPIPVPGHSVKVRFGPELRFDDLIEEYEKSTGEKLRRYHCCADPFCQERAAQTTKDDDLALNVRISSAVLDSFERLSDTVQVVFWRLVARSGVVDVSADRIKVNLPRKLSRTQATCSRTTVREAPPSLMYDRETWTSTPAEKKLYHLVMLRIEEAMQRLCDEDAQEELRNNNDTLSPENPP